MKNTFDTIVVTATICCGLRCARREAKSLEVIRVFHCHRVPARKVL